MGAMAETEGTDGIELTEDGRCGWCGRAVPDDGSPISSVGERNAIIRLGERHWLCSEHGSFRVAPGPYDIPIPDLSDRL